MTLVKGTIGLGIRERHPDADLSKYSEEFSNQWLKELPMANLGETSRRVYHRLLESNGQLLKANIRCSLLSNIESSVEYTCDSLKKHYTAQSVSLTDKQRKVANLCQAIQLEMAIGYKTVIEDLLSDEKYNSELLPLAVNQALFYFHRVQIRCYQLYRDLPPGLWHETHLLYQLAEQNQFHQDKITSNNKSLNTTGIYKKIILLATTNPNQLRQRDIDVIANALGILIRKCKIDSDPDGDYDFVVNLNSDASPFHRALIKDGMKAHYRGLCVKDIELSLQQELKLTEKAKRKTGMEDSILRHLMRSWGTMATRAFSRTAGNGSIQVSVGLSASHFLINKELYGEEPEEPLKGDVLIDSLEGSLKDAIILDTGDSQIYNVPKASHPNWNSNKSGPMIKSEDVWSAAYVKKDATDDVDDKKSYEFMERAPKKAKDSKYDFKDAAIINVSPGGYCLKLDGLLPKQTQTGEVIGLLELSNDDRHIWNIGNIRWMQRHETGDLQLGVQLIAPNAVPVFGQMVTSHMDELSYQRCLLLPALIGIGQPQTILTSPIPFSINHRVRLKNEDSTYDIRLTKLISSSNSYQQFEYDKFEVDVAEDKSDESNSDFDKVWDLL